MDIEFNSAGELYERLLPALKSKKTEIKKAGYPYITEEDIWNYLKQKKWQNSKNLALNEMVSDIFNSDNELIDDYFKSKLTKKSRRMYFEGE